MSLLEKRREGKLEIFLTQTLHSPHFRDRELPLALVSCYNKEMISDLKKLIKDSKKLSDQQRSSLFKVFSRLSEKQKNDLYHLLCPFPMKVTESIHRIQTTENRIIASIRQEAELRDKTA